jgi:nucleoside-diphosphate-sugar epimerase
MRVLVTGATGFVGRALALRLTERGFSVRAAARQPAVAQFPTSIEIMRQGDLAASVDWAPLLAGCDAVVHLAGIAHAGAEISDERYDRINHRATAELVGAAELAGTRFIFVSSIRAQSGPAADHVLTETDEPRPTDAYGVSKLAAETAVRASRLQYTILRPVLVYGAGVKGNLAALIRLAASPWPLPFGGLSNRRSLLNRDSLIDAIEFALQSSAATRETFIVADQTPIALNDLVMALRRGLGKNPRLFSLPRPLLHVALRIAGGSDLVSRVDGELIADPAKLIAAGWKPTADTAAALEKSVREMRVR